MRKPGAVLALMILAVAILATACSKEQKSSEKKLDGDLEAMDTYMSFTLYGDNANAALEAIKAIIKDCESRWSVTDENSEISRLNKEGKSDLTPQTTDILELSKQYSIYTKGCFDPGVYPLVRAWGFAGESDHRVPGKDEIDALKAFVGIDKLALERNTAVLYGGAQFDLGGIAKGYAGDLCIEELKKRGISSAIIRLGGNIQTLGSKPDGSGWKIGVQSPYSDELIGIVTVRDKCVITSGAYERYFTGLDGKRYGHIVSPFTGYPADSGLVSVTVICDKGSLGDALSTALFVMGTDDAISFWKAHEGFDVILLTDEGTLHVSEGIFPAFTRTDSKDVKTVCEIKR